MDWEGLHALRGRDVHVVGLASTECAATIRFLWAEGLRQLTVHDFQPADKLRQAFMRNHVGMGRPERERVWAEIEALPITRRFGADYLSGIQSAEAVFVGQAWYLYPPNLPTLANLRSRGLPFHGLAELYFDLSPAPILAVTGSNGKSTTSRLVEHILRQTDGRIYYAGNERRSVQCLDQLRDMGAGDWLVLEVSNRQLMDVHPHPRIGVVTNVLPNHLDEHGGSFSAYAEVKQRLVATQGKGDYAVLNADNPTTAAWARTLPGRVYWFARHGAVSRGAWVADGRILLRHAPDGAIDDAGPLAAARLPGAHNQENTLAAACAAWLAGASPAEIARGVASFRGLRHRIQLVWSASGVDYYDDLNATTPQATAAAVDALPAPIVLIAGGDDKGLDYRHLASLIHRKVRRMVLLPGPGSDRLAEALAAMADEASPPVDRFDDFRAAVADVVRTARPGDRVLLSPACPYFFRLFYLDDDAEEQGFRQILRELTIGADRGAGDAGGL